MRTYVSDSSSSSAEQQPPSKKQSCWYYVASLSREEHFQPSSKAELPGVLMFELPDDDHLPSRRQAAVDKESSEKVEKPRMSVRELARLLGMMVTEHPAILPAPLHYRNLERAKSTALRQGLHTTRCYSWMPKCTGSCLGG